MKRVSAAAAALFCLGLASQVSAGVIYQQLPTWNANGGLISTGWTSHVDSGNSGFRSFDDFTLASSDVVSEVTWYGVYFNTSGGTLVGSTPNTASWDVSFYDDNGGAPGNELFTQSVSVTRQFLGTNQGLPVAVYSFTAAISGFSATGGSRYWFSVLSHSPTFQPFFSWINGTGGNNQTYQHLLVNGGVADRGVRAQDRAFVLRNTVPEPASLALLGAGVAMVLARRRRA